MQTPLEFIETAGYVFPTGSQQEEVKKLCEEGVLQPLSNIIDVPCPNFYVRAQLKGKFELCSSLWNLFIEYAWISTINKLPDSGQIVLASHGSQQYVCRHNKGLWSYVGPLCNNNFIQCEIPDYWMPIPRGPR